METRLELHFMEAAYDFIIGDDVWGELPSLLLPFDFDRIVLVTDENVQHFYGPALTKLVQTFPRGDCLVLPAGEGIKRLSFVERLTENLLACGASEYSILIGIGGGCIGNLVTFVAGTFFRGVRHVQIPTTLIAMADSVVGHKGAVNVGAIKNACGIFHPPEFIYADLNFLSSLTVRDANNGLAEIVKHGLIEPNSLLARLETAEVRLSGSSPSSLSELLQDTLASRMRLSGNDLLERGEGALLQCGHVIGRAIELICPDLLHGEAVAIGLVEEANLGLSAGFPLSKNLPEKISALLVRCGLPTYMPIDLDRDLLIEQLSCDRRHTSDGGARFAFLRDIGCPLTENGKYWHAVSREKIRSWAMAKTNPGRITGTSNKPLAP